MLLLQKESAVYLFENFNQNVRTAMTDVKAQENNTPADVDWLSRTQSELLPTT